MADVDGEAILAAIEEQRRELVAALRERRTRNPEEVRADAKARISRAYEGTDPARVRDERRNRGGDRGDSE